MYGSFGNIERRNLKQPELGTVDFRIASKRDELNQACGLVYSAYWESGLIAPNPYDMRVTPYHLLETSEVLIAALGDQVISTALLIRDGELGIPMEAIYGDEVEQRRLQGNCVAEVSCLADRRNEFRWAFPVMVRLMSLIAQCGACRGIDQLLIAVHPRHGRFYRRYLGFEMMGSQRAYSAVQGNPAVALSLDLNRLSETNPQGYWKLFGEPFAADVLQYRAMEEQWQREATVMVQSTGAVPKLSQPV